MGYKRDVEALTYRCIRHTEVGMSSREPSGFGSKMTEKMDSRITAGFLICET